MKKQTVQKIHDSFGVICRGAIKLSEFLARGFQADKKLLGKLIMAKSIGMIAGPRGGGKTWLGIFACYSVAGRKDLFPWGLGAGGVAVYMDGEMRACSLQERLKLIHELNSDEESRRLAERNLLIINRDYLGSTIGSIDTEEGQTCIDALIPPETELLVIDNLSSWTSGGREDSQSWATIKNWLIAKRVKGVAVLLIHHTGKNGQQRGTSAHEDLLDFSILLNPLPGDPERNDTKFSIQHTKLRDHLPELRRLFEFSIWFEDGKLKFESAPSGFNAATNAGEMVRMHDEGNSYSDIGKHFGVSRVTAWRAVTKYREQLETFAEDESE